MRSSIVNACLMANSASTRLRSRSRRHRAGGGSRHRPLGRPRRQRRAARFLVHRAGDPRVHRRPTASAAWTASPSARTPPSSARSSPRRRWKRRSRRCRRSSGAVVEADWAKTRKYWQAYEKQGKEPGYFGIFIDPTKCKGCAECVQVCDDHALKMIKKTDTNMPVIREKFDHFQSRGPDAERVHQRQGPGRHDAGGLGAPVRRRGGIVRGLRRGDGAAHVHRRHVLQVRPGERRADRRDRVQHGLHLDLSVQPVHAAVDATRCSRTRRRSPWASAPSGTSRGGATSGCGSSAATGR